MRRRRPKLFQFYRDAQYGLLRFIGGPRDGNLIFERWDRAWGTNEPQMVDHLNLEEYLYLEWMRMGKVRAVPPPS